METVVFTIGKITAPPLSINCGCNNEPRVKSTLTLTLMILLWKLLSKTVTSPASAGESVPSCLQKNKLSETLHNSAHQLLTCRFTIRWSHFFISQLFLCFLSWMTYSYWFLHDDAGCIYCRRKINESPRLAMKPLLIQIAAVWTLIIVVKATSAHTDSKYSLVVLCNISRTTHPAKTTAHAGLIEEKTAANGQTVGASFKSRSWDDSQGHTLTKFITLHHHYQSPHRFSIHPGFPAFLFIAADLMTGSLRGIGYVTPAFLPDCLRSGFACQRGGSASDKQDSASKLQPEIKPGTASVSEPSASQGEKLISSLW